MSSALEHAASQAAKGGGRGPNAYDPGQYPVAFIRQSGVGVDAETYTLTLADGTAYVFENDTSNDGVVSGNIGFVPASTSVANTIAALADAINSKTGETNVLCIPSGTAGELVLIERVLGPKTVTVTESATNATVVDFVNGNAPGRNIAVQSRAASAGEDTAAAMLFIFPFAVDGFIVTSTVSGVVGPLTDLAVTTSTVGGFGIVKLADGASTDDVDANTVYTVIAWGD